MDAPGSTLLPHDLAHGGSLGGADVLFADGGACGELMRAHPWASSPLGPVEGWPQSLRTCVRIILTSRQPMFVWWGAQLVNLYNDAYLDIIGGKHPTALGQPAREVWSEIWDEVGPRAESALRTNRGTYDEALLLIMQRHGYQEETYYTFSYSPVPGDDGAIGGIICANTDETRRIIDERRLAVLRDLAARMADARSGTAACQQGALALRHESRDLPFALIYLVDDDQATLTLAAHCGIDAGHPAALTSIAAGGPSPWPVSAALATRSLQVCDVGGGAGLPNGAWSQPPAQVAAVPLLRAGEAGCTGVLVVGLNPFRKFDARYRDFLTLVAVQITAGIAHAQAYHEERRRAEALAELDRTKTEFFSNVSHEFRTPLTLMLGPLEDGLADREEALGPRQRERAELVQRNGLRLLRLVNSLLDFSRIEAGRMQVAAEPLDLGAATADAASCFRSAIERAGMTLQVDCPPLAEVVAVDRDMWEKIVLNLLSNAFKHTFSGTIAVALRRVGAMVELAVTDTGVGIAADQLPRLFERFHRVQGARSRTHEGTGIGLALVQELVRLHGGTVQVRSQVDCGSTFTVTIPATGVPPREIAVATPPAPAAGSQAAAFVEEAMRWLPAPQEAATAEPSSAVLTTGQGGRILVADDNADMRTYLQRLLGGRWQVQAVGDGAAALAAVRADPPDLIISDVMMPGLDGIGLLRALRQDEASRHLPVILLSARAGEVPGIAGLEAGADDYLVKPFAGQELIARVAAHLQLKRQRDLAADGIRRQERLLRLVTDHARIGLVMIDGQHRYRFANPTYGELLGLGASDLIGRSVGEVLGAVYEQEIRPRLERAFAGERVSYELRLPPGGRREQERFFAVTYEPRLDLADGRCVVVVVNDISERKRSEDSLRRSTETLQLALGSARMAAWSYDLASGRIITGTNLGEMIGLLPGQQLGDRGAGLDLVHQDDAGRHADEVRTALQEGRRYRSLFRLRRPLDGRLLWLEEHGEAHSEDGQRRMSGVTVDVTQRVVAEEAVRRSEALFRGIVNQSLAGIAVTAADGRFTMVNDRYCLITGYDRDQLLTMTKVELTHPDDRDRCREMLLRIAADGQVFEAEKRYLRADGTPVWVHNSVSAIHSPEGGPVRLILVTIDISERKRQELALRHQSEQYATLLRQSPVGVYVVDADFRIRDVNPVARPVFGDGAGEIIGRDFSEVVHRLWQQDYADDVVAIFRHTLQSGVSYHAPERIGPRTDGSAACFEWRVDRITQPDGRYGVVCYFQDISHQVAARETLAQRAEELRRANIELEHFASIASHDLQEPLRMISSYADILLRRYQPTFDERGRLYFDRIISAAQRMRSLINALLSYSLVGKQEVCATATPLAQVLQDTLEVLQEMIAGKSAQVSHDELPVVHADPVRLAQLLQNLISNALKFSDPVRPPVIRIVVREEAREWRVAVCDNGIGIPPSARERIFQIFQRLHAPDEYPGSGIGLATCKKIVEQHGGRIGVDSEVGRGSTFWFTLAKPPSAGPA